VAKKKNNKINPIIYLLICCVLLFVIFNSISVFVLGLFGETTVGVITSYDSRLDDHKAEANRSRTVSKGYRFTVHGKEYKGYVIYKSDEAWPGLHEGEVRRENISYLGILPFINKPVMLVDFDELGVPGLLCHIFAILGSGFLFLMINGWLPKRKKKRKKKGRTKRSNTRRDDAMFCQSCGAKLPEGAVFCANCGVSVQKAHPGICTSCGAKLPDDAAFCTNCGVPIHKAEGEAINASVQASAPPRKDKPPHNETTLVGWSPRSNDPEILEAARKNKKSAMGCAWTFALLFPIGFLLAGLFVDEMPLNEAIIIGVGLGVVMLVINLVRAKGMKRPVWEGVVVQKYKKERQRHRDDTVDTYTEYTTVIKTDAGKKKQIVERDSGRDMYDYLAVGDRVRYHPAFETYEKFDKSKDRIIYCNVCRMMNPIANDRCKRCNNLLFK
jgi:ribosomal protein L40E